MTSLVECSSCFKSRKDSQHVEPKPIKNIIIIFFCVCEELVDPWDDGVGCIQPIEAQLLRIADVDLVFALSLLCIDEALSWLAVVSNRGPLAAS